MFFKKKRFTIVLKKKNKKIRRFPPVTYICNVHYVCVHEHILRFARFYNEPCGRHTRSSGIAWQPGVVNWRLKKITANSRKSAYYYIRNVLNDYLLLLQVGTK